MTRIVENTTSGRQFFKVPGVGFYSSLKSSAAVVFVYKPGQMFLTKSAPGRFQNMSFLEKQNPIFSQNRITFFFKNRNPFSPQTGSRAFKKTRPTFFRQAGPVFLDFCCAVVDCVADPTKSTRQIPSQCIGMRRG